ncbi:ABC transporter ATP-binding protein [Salipaludibacillus agaradhaerens]|jgi:putative hydroxymethylpyrimidine transport system ATP-binding protein|uniref:ABC transporter ATP-binding protein n=1 Tax=Salipaludibacillus agaradhaerens TaxID=76935 RepID=UPI000998850D|nr:ABC transporter ATP-binding protein [Salipaludibacillus agaradhaerens]
MKSAPSLAFKDVSFGYEEKHHDSPLIFEEMSLSVNENEFVVILGPSGSGKSTFFRLASGLEQPDSGQISIRGKEMKERLGEVGYMPQKGLLLPWRTVMENGRLPLEIKGVPKKEAEEKVKDYIDKFGLKGTENKLPHQLSGGMQQRVSFLRAMLSGSDILLLDEPFSALDSLTRFMMQEWLLTQWHQWPKTIIFITHDMEEAIFLADRILVLTQKTRKKELAEIPVPLPRPRTDEVRITPTFMKLKEKLLKEMRGEV